MGNSCGDCPLPFPWCLTTATQALESFSFYSSADINKCRKIERGYYNEAIIMIAMIEIQAES